MRVILCMLAALIICASSATAATYTTAIDPYGNFDFGHGFTTIESISIHYSGTFSNGMFMSWFPDYSYDPPHMVEMRGDFSAFGFLKLADNATIYGFWSGNGAINGDCDVSALRSSPMFLNEGSGSFYLDVPYTPASWGLPSGAMITQYPSFSSSFLQSVTVTGESSVPEPSSILALLCGMGGVVGLAWRRKLASA